MKKTLCTWISSLLLGSSAVFSATTLDQYRSIVVSEKAGPVVAQAAEDLQYYLRKVAGRELPITHAVPDDGTLSFVVGPGVIAEADAAMAALPREGWMVKSVKEGILLGGNDEGPFPNYTFYHAVPHFLKKHCHVRWIWPGETGEITPRQPKLAFGELDEQGAPVLKRRRIDFYFKIYWKPEVVEAFGRWKRNSFLGDQVRASFAHAWAGLFKLKDFQEHPEWFAMVDGERRAPTREAMNWQLCLTNVAMRDAFYQRLTRRLSGNNIVSISPNDGAGFCECEACQKAGPLGELYWEFAADMATRMKKEHPQNGIGTFAYTFFRQPPQRIEKLPDNLLISMTTYSCSHANPEAKADFLQFLQAWKSKGTGIMMREYWGMHYWQDLPILYPHEIADGIRIARQAGLYGAYGEGGKNWGTQALNYYVLTNMMWNPEAEVEEILAEFYDCFGPAKEAVRAYFDLLEKRVAEVWREENPGSSWRKNASIYGRTFNPEVMARAAAHLEEAARRARGDAALEARIADLKLGCEFSTVVGELYALYTQLEMGVLRDETRKPLSFEERKQALERAWELGQRRIELLNRARNGFVLDEGLYAHYIDSNSRHYHRGVAELLGKQPSEMTKLDYIPQERK
ncbi:MAG TPA: DUF4838 domain-containing protein [Chthoniobacteraceae bacterium]|nr:DUF4838 domain-containing protein [Chthoniobacteraceae bacterium]